jgi:hypothetical protein
MLSKADCFKFFGVTPKNIQWSWSARKGNTVVICLWQDCYGRPRDGKLPIEQDCSRTHHDFRQSPGFNELCENLQYAKDHCGGKFNAITLVAKDTAALPRHAATQSPSGLAYQIKSWNPETGRLVAEASLRH